VGICGKISFNLNMLKKLTVRMDFSGEMGGRRSEAFGQRKCRWEGETTGSGLFTGTCADGAEAGPDGNGIFGFDRWDGIPVFSESTNSLRLDQPFWLEPFGVPPSGGSVGAELGIERRFRLKAGLRTFPPRPRFGVPPLGGSVGAECKSARRFHLKAELRTWGDSVREAR
jgi:hypothetical protein